MMFGASARRRFSLLTVVFFLVATLMSLAASAGDRGDGARTIWLDVCGTGPAVAMVVPGDDADANPHASGKQGHCVLCFTPGSDPSGVESSLSVAAAGSVLPVLHVSRHWFSRDWNPGHARAPPVLS